MLKEQPFYQPKEGTYMKLIVLLGKSRQPQHAHQLFDTMVEEGREPTLELYTALLAAYCRSNLIDEDKQVTFLREKNVGVVIRDERELNQIRMHGESEVSLQIETDGPDGTWHCAARKGEHCPHVQDYLFPFDRKKRSSETHVAARELLQTSDSSVPEISPSPTKKLGKRDEPWGHNP
ncbi:hypothetical protein RHMOL_Rhmol02G0065200 [Rhododendron molle]|uniref:Uncharacterized protein n=1 Tax=Rhododendron molle TaxID=49168 RepID=A0ACC0PLY0_RHOML|nr:hypothetical protein RHMOL_Rhmol02G0065200 [Rhododendron molle]